MAVKAGEADYGLAVGVEKLAGAGLLAGGERTEDAKTWTPEGRFGAVAPLDGRVGTETMPGVFAQIGMEYGQKWGGTSFELFARISEKNHAHSTLNPLAAYSKRMTLEQIMGDVMIAYPNTRAMCSANCDGAAAAVVVSDAKLKTLSLEQRRRAVKVAASVLTSDPWVESGQSLPDIHTLTKNAASRAYEAAGIGPDDLDLVELHDCFATAELVHYDNLSLCEPGGAVDFFTSGATWRDGRMPVNVSGGLESKGHPVAATGIANIWEMCHHLRGEAGDAPDRGRQGRPGTRDRAGIVVRRAHLGEGGGLTASSALSHGVGYETGDVDAAGHDGAHGAPVGDEVLPGDVARQLGVQEDERPGLLVGGRAPPERDREIVHELLADVLLEVGHHRRIRRAGADAIDPDALLGQCVRRPERPDDDGFLGRAVPAADLLGVGFAPLPLLRRIPAGSPAASICRCS